MLYIQTFWNVLNQDDKHGIVFKKHPTNRTKPKQTNKETQISAKLKCLVKNSKNILFMYMGE